MRRLELGPQMLLLIKSLQNEGIAEAMRERSSSSVVLSRRSPGVISNARDGQQREVAGKKRQRLTNSS
jgi:hypothetical protein